LVDFFGGEEGVGGDKPHETNKIKTMYYRYLYSLSQKLMIVWLLFRQ
jgi:hypothetical protein